MCKADSSEILSTFEVVLPPSIVDTCQRMRPGISTCFLAVNKEDRTSSQITVAKQTDESVVLKVSVMALGKSKREQHRPIRIKANKDHRGDSGANDSDELQSKASLEEMELFIQKARAHAEQLSSDFEQNSSPGPIRRKPGPAFTKKPGYVPGKSKKPALEVNDAIDVPTVRNTYEKINTGKHSKKFLVGEESKRTGPRYVPSTKLNPKKKDDKGNSNDSSKKQSGNSRFAKTQATLAAIEAANKKKPSYIGNLRSRKLTDVNIPPRQTTMPVLQSDVAMAEGTVNDRPVHTSKVTSVRGRRNRPTQPYGQPRPTGMNKSLTKIWGNKKKRMNRKGNKISSNSKQNTNSLPSDQLADLEGDDGDRDVEGDDEDGSTPVDVSASESTIVITVSEGHPVSSTQGSEILHHKKRWAAANSQLNDEKQIQEINLPEEGIEELTNQGEEGEITFEEGDLQAPPVEEEMPLPTIQDTGPDIDDLEVEISNIGSEKQEQKDTADQSDEKNAENYEGNAIEES